MVFVDGLLMFSGSEGYKLPPPGGVRGRTPSVPGQPNTGSSKDGRVSARGTLVWVDGWHAAAQRMGNDTSPQHGSCRLTFGYRTRTI
jgi:hypothetical protein